MRSWSLSEAGKSSHWKRPGSQAYITECIHQLVLESQLPHEFVNLLFILVIVNDKLTDFWGS
jgi:hypothetical protein